MEFLRGGGLTFNEQSKNKPRGVPFKQNLSQPLPKPAKKFYCNGLP